MSTHCLRSWCVQQGASRYEIAKTSLYSQINRRSRIYTVWYIAVFLLTTEFEILNAHSDVWEKWRYCWIIVLQSINLRRSLILDRVSIYHDNCHLIFFRFKLFKTTLEVISIQIYYTLNHQLSLCFSYSLKLTDKTDELHVCEFMISNDQCSEIVHQRRWVTWQSKCSQNDINVILKKKRSEVHSFIVWTLLILWNVESCAFIIITVGEIEWLTHCESTSL